MRIKLLFSMTFLGLILSAHVQAADLQKEISDKVMNALSDEGYLNDLSDNEITYVSNALNNVIAQKLANAQLEGLDLTDGSQQQFLGGLVDAIKSVGKKIVSGIKSISSKVKSIAQSFVSKAGSFVKKYGPDLVKKGVGLAANLLPLAADVLAPEFAIPIQVASGIISSVVKKLGKNASHDQILDAAAEHVKSMSKDL